MIVAGRNIIIVIALFITVTGAHAQQDTQISQYMFNNLFLNPAYAGVEGIAKAQLMHRSQWLGYTGTFDQGGAPVSQILTLDAPILRFRSGAGLMIVSDNLGPQNNLEIQANVAYHLEVGKGKMSFGLRGGIFSQSIDFNLYRPIDPNDPLIADGKESQIRPDMGIGVFYKTEKYYAGVSMSHIIKSEFDFNTDYARNPLQNHLYVTGGYNVEMNLDWVLTPSLLVKTDFNTYSFDASVVGTYKERFWTGLSVRQSEAVIVLLGYSLLKDNSMRLGYSMDYVFEAQDAKRATSHEFLISYALPVVTGGGRKVVRTPRFRH
ncbi:MAG: type IX secretion system membrane protein PorP/SprF [Cyclobacteriaceae bacterium]|nr:type IX secretion system membrane protein PorP/SprF [Cyclobacteriaceae bacterium]